MSQVTIYNALKENNEAYINQLSQALPEHIKPERMVRMILTSFAQTPKLKECDQASIWKSVLDCCAIGLEPGALGHAYLLPYKSKSGMQCQLQIGYKGLIELAMRSGKVSSIYADVVCENDVFEYERGTDEKLIHRPLMKGDRGRAYCYYAYAKMLDGGFNADVMFIEDIEAIQKRSKAEFGPWKTDFVEMAKKTVIKRLSKKLPLSPEFHDAIAKDNEATGLKTIDVPEQPKLSIAEPIIEQELDDGPNID